MDEHGLAPGPHLRTIGAWWRPTGSEFTVWAPLARRLELLIELTSLEEDPQKDAAIFYHAGRPYRSHSMSAAGGGYWRAEVSVPLRTRYYYRIDGERICPDPASFCQPRGVHGPSELIEHKTISWTDEKWKGLPLRDMIIYELHTGCFSSTHDFNGVVAKLDYLADLGINAIELMPLAQFPGERNWGYDGVYPFSIQPSYGGVDQFGKLVNAAHAKGIAVIVDVVYNHFGPEGAYVTAFAPFFTDKYKTPWGKALNFDDRGSDGVRNYFLQHARMLLEDHHVDGLRLDAVHAIMDFGARHFMQQLKELATAIGERTGRHKVLIAESDLNDPRYINPLSKGGYNLDGQWVDEFHHALRAYMTGERHAYLEDFGELSHLGCAFTHTYVYGGVYSQHRDRTFGAKAIQNTYDQFVVFSQNHDQVGNRVDGGRLTAVLSQEQLKLVAGTVLLSPYVPLLFMGEEYGEKNPFQYFVSFTDPELISSIRDGRKREFAGFVRGGEIPDPEAAETFLRSNLSWRKGSDEGAALLGFYRHLIAFRKQRPAMQARTRDSFAVHGCENGLLYFERTSGQDSVLVFLNFHSATSAAGNKTGGTLHLWIDSSSSKWLGPSVDSQATVEADAMIKIPPHSCLVFNR